MRSPRSARDDNFSKTYVIKSARPKGKNQLDKEGYNKNVIFK